MKLYLQYDGEHGDRIYELATRLGSDPSAAVIEAVESLLSGFDIEREFWEGRVTADIEARLRNAVKEGGSKGYYGYLSHEDVLAAADYIRDLEEVAKAAEECERACFIDTLGGDTCFSTQNSIPMGMSPHKKARVRALRNALSALERQKEGPR